MTDQTPGHNPYQPAVGHNPYQPAPGAPYHPQVGYVPTKSHAAAILLSFFLGTFGIDRFYLGHVGLGIAKLLLSWATLGLWQLIDFLVIIVKGTDALKRIHWT